MPMTILHGPWIGCLPNLASKGRRREGVWSMLVKNHWLDRCRRAVRMDWGELRMRTRQEIAKRSVFPLGRMGVRVMKNCCGSPAWRLGRLFFLDGEGSQSFY